jgi:hypothetical protein
MTDLRNSAIPQHLLAGNLYQMRNRVACGFSTIFIYKYSGRAYEFVRGFKYIQGIVRKEFLNSITAVPKEGWELLLIENQKYIYK